jgi:hypothetical protein
MRTEWLVLLLLTGVFCARPTLAQKADPLQLVQTIPLPGVEGRIDHLAADLKGQRLFIAALGNNTVEVVDLRAGKRAHTIQGLHEPQGVAFVPEVNRLFVGCRNPAKVLVYDTDSGKTVTSVEIAGDTDDIFYDAARKRLYASCGAGFLSVLQQHDADHYSALARIPTAAGARTSFFVPQLGRLYLAVPHRGSQKAELRVFAVQP